MNWACNAVSRVHLCLLLDEQGLWAIDVASTNGSFTEGKKFQSLPLFNATQITLGEVATVQWIPA
jgi:pSer/pThr/pTyr-binding forkhead associated (FHA) protein